jgi:hypothetical protein
LADIFTLSTSFDGCLEDRSSVGGFRSLPLDFYRVPSHRNEFFVAQARWFTVCQNQICQVSEEHSFNSQSGDVVYECVESNLGNGQHWLKSNYSLNLLRNMLRLGRVRELPATSQQRNPCSGHGVSTELLALFCPSGST